MQIPTLSYYFSSKIILIVCALMAINFGELLIFVKGYGANSGIPDLKTGWLLGANLN